MYYKLFFEDEFFKYHSYAVKVSKEEFFARVDFLSEHFEIEKKDLDLDRLGYYANNILFGILRVKGE